ncbi:MAG: hypothetical protein HY360_06340 [Verrucomicrobia bacterium]|nr:hypothetical protein [Verrucomicrobiota bacterium]
MITPDEHGFWDYTAPGSGGMERYARDDFLLLLDDMRGANMNSLLVMVKWFTTGYRSRLPFLDQHPSNLLTASDNQLLLDIMDEARKRGIAIWLGAVVNIYHTEKIRSPSWTRVRREISSYDIDSEEIQDHAVEMCRELVTLFPRAAGLLIEVEFCGIEMPHRIPLYNAWAKENGRPSFEQIGRPLNPRLPEISPWRDYTTQRRAELLRKIEQAVKEQGFHGQIATICETGRLPYLVTQDVSLEMLHAACPDLGVVSYECLYDKSRNRFGMMEMAIEEPKRAGMKTYYLPRGVMTYAYPDGWPMPLSLQQSWQMDLEDIARFQPHGVWWFGSGHAGDGMHVHLDRLRQSGFQSGVETRRALLKRIADFQKQ